MFIVIPKKDNKNNSLRSFRSILRLRNAKGKRINDAMKNLEKASAKGDISVRVHLKIGAAAPQIMLAIINARITSFLSCIFNSGCQGFYFYFFLDFVFEIF